MEGCKVCEHLQEELQGARQDRNFERAKTISLNMSDHVQIGHPDLWAKSFPIQPVPAVQYPPNPTRIIRG